MADYKTMYFQLAAKVADVIDLLIAAQQQCEDTYIESGDEQDSSDSADSETK